MTNEKINEVIGMYIKTNIFKEKNSVLDCSKNLFIDYGFDSITIIELLIYLEEKFSIQFDLINLDLAELNSINSISNNVNKMLVERKL